MNANFIDYLTVISPYTMYTKQEEEVTVLYLKNKSHLTATEMRFLLDIIINHLTLFVMSRKNSEDVDIEPVVTLVETDRGDLDCIVIIRNKQLEGVKIVNGGDFNEATGSISHGEYPIDYILSAHEDRYKKSTALEVTLGKMYEGTLLEIMNRLEYLFESTNLKVYREGGHRKDEE